jgi:uncharacterized metal-binding protein
MASIEWVDYKKKLGKQLTDNVRANEIMAPVYLGLVTLLLNFHLKIPVLSNKLFHSGLFWGFMSTLIYVFASNYFQPDLDISHNRPGMSHFPFGRWVGAYKYGRFLKWVAWPINRIWYYLWDPYGQLLTHRGVGHWPFLGVFLRVGYLWVMLTGMRFMSLYLFHTDIPGFHNIISYLTMFSPLSGAWGTFPWFVACFPIFISDLLHIVVDYRDSARKGISFCPPAIPRGLIMHIINGIRDIKRDSKK